MLKILDRYLLREIAVYFFVCLLSLTGILLTLRMLRFASLIINRGVEPLQIVQVFLSIVPTFLEIAIPLACLLGVMLAFARLSGDSELIVLRASGISLIRTAVPVGIFAILVTIAGIYVSVSLRPWGFKTLNQSLFEIARSRSTSGLSPGVFNKLGALTLYAEQIDYQTGALTKVMIDDKRAADQRKIIIADRGTITSDPVNRSITLLLESGTIHEHDDNRYFLTEFVENGLVISPEEIFLDGSKRGVSQRELSTPELRSFISKLKVSAVTGQIQGPQVEEFSDLTREQLLKKQRRSKIELGQRFSLPFASLVMALLGMSLGILPPRAQKTWGAGLSTAIGLLVFVIYYSLFSFGLAFAEQGSLKIWIALWIPNIVLLGLAVFLVQRLATEKWSSVVGIFKIK